MKVYLIGSLRNPEVPRIAAQLEAANFNVFQAWYSAGPTADDSWRDHEKSQGHDFVEALQGDAARHVFEFDKHHLETSDAVVLLLPAGKSGHMELGWALGGCGMKGKLPGFILLDSPERWDVMYAFATGVARNVNELLRMLRSVDMQQAVMRRTS